MPINSGGSTKDMTYAVLLSVGLLLAAYCGALGLFVFLMKLLFLGTLRPLNPPPSGA